ncbi:hypothetical protein [Dolosicoccus paucivorans]|uniref:hypothetical protein n=1 Tax=Dolosicoccus paucivorans TaxID=84521 RepID=UPI0008828ED8|nr:hypothetical protein [Dolosicoccus paucivorans]SDI40746.1 hypothetical protein SAMN04487994_101024 [Dolosicoccus paucivorans]
MKVTCIYGFEWDGDIVAEQDNTFIMECKDTGTRHVVRKEELGAPDKRYHFIEREFPERFKTKEDLFVYQNQMQGTLIFL